MEENGVVLESIDQQINDCLLQEFALTHFPEQVFVFEPEITVSGMVSSLQKIRQDLEQHRILYEEFALSHSGSS